MKIVTVVGARPQFMKAVTVSRQLQIIGGIQEVMVHTGQHYDDTMSGRFFHELLIAAPKYNLGVGSASHAVQTARILEALDVVLETENPDWVIVYGDTNSTLAAAIAAAKRGIPLAHVEAGVRCFDQRVPEEINRVVTDHVSTRLYAPTENARRMLIREAIEPSAVVLAGDVMLDCVLWHRERAWKSSRILDTLRLDTKAFVLATVHRSENTDDQHKLGTIVQVLKEARSIGPVVLPVHPRTHRALTEYSLMDRLSRCVTVIEPVGYLDMLVLMESALLVVSDSGGVPKEASFLGTPSLMLRANTEWPELIESGAAVLVEPSSAEVVLAALQGALELRVDNTMKLFGDGNAAIRVVRNLCG